MAAASTSVYRPELQGLRAVAIGMVVVYHVFLDRVSGGVDVFLLISAFLMTGSFARRMERGQPLGVLGYWIQAFKRLLPPAVATILATLVLMRLFFPAFRWREILAQSLASLFYVENWYLASQSVDYYAVDRTVASPLQHFWSLSIQGQVFVVWPLLFLIALAAHRRLGWHPRAALAAVLTPVFAASLAWSVWVTRNQQEIAYFDTFARLWEFALGSLLAIALPLAERRWGFGPGTAGRPQPLVALRVLSGWLGLASMLAVGVTINVAGAFPGWIALWPLLSACLIIAAGHTGTRWGVDHWLSSKPLHTLGDWSYALYLVHWPILITLLTFRDAARTDLRGGTAVIITSLVLAWALTRFLDTPIRTSARLRRRPRYAALVIIAALLVGSSPVVAFRAALDAQAQRAIERSEANNPGAAVLTGASLGPEDPTAPVVPLLQDIPFDWMSLGEGCHGPLVPQSPDLAAACAATPGGNPNKVIVAVGNSRLQQFNAALAPLAERHNYKVVSFLMGGCAFTITGSWPECNERNQEVLDYILQIRPRAVYTTSTWIDETGRETVLRGLPPALEQLSAAGIDVIGLRDQPRLPFHPLECLEFSSEEECTGTTDGMFAATDVNAALTEHAVGPGRFLPVDLTPWICPDGSCPPEIGNVYVFLDGNHLSQVYARTLAPVLATQLEEAGWRW